MYKGLLILSVIVVAASVGLTCLGYHAVAKWSEGLEGARLGEFAEVAEQIRQDVRRKLDEFVAMEQQRPYTDYLRYYVPDNLADETPSMPRLRSPLAGQFTNSFARGYFQVEPSNEIVTPYDSIEPGGQAESNAPVPQVEEHLENLKKNLLPVIENRREMVGYAGPPPTTLEEEGALASGVEREQSLKGSKSRSKSYAIESLQQQRQMPQIVTQDRSIVASNYGSPTLPQEPTTQQQLEADPRATDVDSRFAEAQDTQARFGRTRRQQAASAPMQAETRQRNREGPTDAQGAGDADESVVQIRIDPFMPVVVPGGDRKPSVFGGQVFLLRHVQIEDRRLLQGFQLDEARLIEEVQESAERLMREGMAFELPQIGGTQIHPVGAEAPPAYTAILDFGFGELVLALREVDPGWITKRIGELQHIYLGITTVVAMAVLLALLGLWRATRAQVSLAKKKDEFISAVSHELRTPLTSIRMYAEMLENNWLASKEKTGEYHRNIRQESERLSRLIENVLDFSRLQRGRKRYDFCLGDVNACVADVVAMMRPYAAEHGFEVETDLAELPQVRFDRDAIAQIVVNLLDNAVKYARSAEDKTIFVRTRMTDGFAIVEVEDHGPGVPHRQQKRVFEQFYRCPQDAGKGSQVAGTGLGLSLVRRFAQAHDGFVEILSARPRGAIFRVGLAVRM